MRKPRSGMHPLLFILLVLVSGAVMVLGSCWIEERREAERVRTLEQQGR